MHMLSDSVVVENKLRTVVIKDLTFVDFKKFFLDEDKDKSETLEETGALSTEKDELKNLYMLKLFFKKDSISVFASIKSYMKK